jgi:hypothetical protein
MSELNLGPTASIRFPEGREKLLNFEVTLRPDEGLYKGGAFTFTFAVSPVYPHEPPKVKCRTKVRTSARRGKAHASSTEAPPACVCAFVDRCITQTSTWRATCASTSCVKIGSLC